MRTLDRKVLRDLWRLKYQALTIALVLASGITALLTFLSTEDSLRRGQNQFYQEARFAQVFAELKRAPVSLAKQLEQIPGVVSLETRIVKDFLLNLPNQSEPGVGRFIAIPEDNMPRLNRLYLKKGRMLDPQSEHEVIISEAFAEANGFVPGDWIAAIVNGRYQRYQVVGVALSAEYVYTIRPGSSVPNDRLFGIFWTSKEGLESALDMKESFNSVSMILGPGSSEQFVIDRLDYYLEDYGGLGAYGRADQFSHQFLTDELRQLKVMAIAIPLIFLWVAAFLLHVVLERMVGIQRPQIATLKAMGYSNRNIASHYLKLVSWIIALAILIGMVLGYILGENYTKLFTRFYRFPVMIYALGPHLILIAIVVSFGAGMVGVYSALKKVFRLNPAEAMRPPAPPNFHESFWESLGITRWLSKRGRILFRNLTLRPWRTSLNIMGIGFAVMVTMLGLFWWDTINFIIYSQFSLIQKEDAQVTFIDEAPDKILWELENIPGVLNAEGYRSIPIRVKYGHLEEKTALNGYPRDPQLRKLLNRDWQDVSLPPEGLFLSNLLAEKLGVRAGEFVNVEMMEGEQLKWRLPVMGVVSQWLGYGAYMDLSALHRLLGDRKISTAQLKLDMSQERKIQETLKEFPKVAAVDFKKTSLRAFENTIVKIIIILATAFTAFALVIAIGVVYNNARVALSERVWELMSLRVLGFTRKEVFKLLGGEILVQVMAALPVGWIMGYLFAALLVQLMQTETFDIPVVMSRQTFAWASLVIFISAVVSAWIINRRLNQTDLVAALKVRE